METKLSELIQIYFEWREENPITDAKLTYISPLKLTDVNGVPFDRGTHSELLGFSRWLEDYAPTSKKGGE